MRLHAVRTSVPTPNRERWQPLRAGLVDLFYYDYQEFWFRDGRLMLRGNNGTGKSKVLALTLPFLLDGDISAHRVEPDGDPGKRMEWNLLLGGKYEERLGYTWLEFGRITEDGGTAYLTIGCGLKAVAGRGIADRWYFVTPLRVGVDLFLIGPSGTALTKDRLTDAIGTEGYVTQKVELYRRAVDEHLFHLGPERYDALVNLLIQLRQPQLSKRPDPERLSRALSEALAPVDPAVITDIAAAFHDLEHQRDELASLRETRNHVARFLDRYRHYARVAARRQAEELRLAQSAYERTGRDLSAVREEIDQARAEQQQAETRLEEIGDTLAELTAAREELAARPELKSLEDAERYAKLATEAAGSAARRAEEAVRTRDSRKAKRDEAAQKAEASRARVTERLGTAADAASRAGLGLEHAELEHAELVERLRLPAEGGFPDAALDAALQAAEHAAEHAADRRERAVKHVLELAEAAAEADEALTHARRLLGEREADRDAAAGRKLEADERVGAEAARLVAAWREYLAGVTELRPPAPDDLLPELAAWAETLDGENPAQAAVRSAESASHVSLAAAYARAEAKLQVCRDDLRDLRAERERLRSGEHAVPPAPHTRAEGVRDGRPGAPLWQVTDFADGLSAVERAGLEAALEASGLLDAWVTPDGRLLDPGTYDVVVTATQPVAANLGAVLRPAIDADDPQAGALRPEAVAAVLAGIGLGEAGADTWVDADGRWQVGPLRGEWAKPDAEYIGHGAREEARRRRLALLEQRISETEAAVRAAEAELAAVEQRQRVLADELERQPGDQALRDAHGAAVAAAHELDRAAGRVQRQEEKVKEAEQAARKARRDLDEAASDLRLPTARSALAEVRSAVAAYRAEVFALISEVRQHAGQVAHLATWEAEYLAAEEAVRTAEEQAREAKVTAREAEGRLATLQGAIGATVEELRNRLAATKQCIDELNRESKRLRKRNDELIHKLGQAEGRKQELDGKLGEARRHRDRAAAGFHRFATTGLLAVAVPELDVPSTPWSPDPAVRLARRVEQALGGVEHGDGAWKRVQDEITRRFQELAETLSRHGHHAAAGMEEDCFVVTVTFQGRERAVDELAGLLDAEVEYRQRMLTAKERELLEEHLVNDVASHLQELISEAEAQVAEMNAELAERPTSTGMRLRLRWEPRPDGPAGLPEARRRLLRQEAELWSAEDRAAVSEFLQRRIEEERARDERGTWQDHLARALDYRSWHRFTIERWQDGRWRPATGPASGGERVLTVTLPLFAAASAHYRSAHPHAPRLVMLDEAFAGVDDDARAKCLGLLVTFDLDVVMTSEREWGFYATVPGIATHQLVRRDGIDAVHVTVWEWDGRLPQQVERDFAPRVEEEDQDRGADALW